MLHLASYFVGVLKSVSEKCVKGASVREICIYGDQLLVEETGKVYKKEKELTKGLFIYFFNVTLFIFHRDCFSHLCIRKWMYLPLFTFGH